MSGRCWISDSYRSGPPAPRLVRKTPPSKPAIVALEAGSLRAKTAEPAASGPGSASGYMTGTVNALTGDDHGRYQLSAFGASEVHHHGAFAPVEAGPEYAFPFPRHWPPVKIETAARWVDTDHVVTEPGQGHAGERCGDEGRQLDDRAGTSLRCPSAPPALAAPPAHLRLSGTSAACGRLARSTLVPGSPPHPRPLPPAPALPRPGQ